MKKDNNTSLQDANSNLPNDQYLHIMKMLNKIVRGQDELKKLIEAHDSEMKTKYDALYKGIEDTFLSNLIQRIFKMLKGMCGYHLRPKEVAMLFDMKQNTVYHCKLFPKHRDKLGIYYRWDELKPFLKDSDDFKDYAILGEDEIDIFNDHEDEDQSEEDNETSDEDLDEGDEENEEDEDSSDLCENND